MLSLCTNRGNLPAFLFSLPPAKYSSWKWGCSLRTDIIDILGKAEDSPNAYSRLPEKMSRSNTARFTDLTSLIVIFSVRNLRSFLPSYCFLSRLNNVVGIIRCLEIHVSVSNIQERPFTRYLNILRLMSFRTRIFIFSSISLF